MSLLRFKISNAKAVDVDGTLNFTTDWLELEYSMPFSISLTNTVADGTPTYNVEVSNDKTQVYPHSSAFTGVALDSAVDSSDVRYKYIRVAYLAGAATAGVVNPFINLSIVK